MKLKELVEQYGEYTVPQELIEKLEKPKPQSVWDLEGREAVFTLNCDGFIEDDTWYDCLDDERDNGNIFLTYEDAVIERERRKVETLLIKHGGRRWFNGYNHNFYIGLDEYEEHLKAYILMTPTQGTIYFDSKDNARKAIDEIGEERIKKALFEVR